MRPAGASGHCGLLTAGAWQQVAKQREKNGNGHSRCCVNYSSFAKWMRIMPKQKKGLYYIWNNPSFGGSNQPQLFLVRLKISKKINPKNFACGTRLKTFQEPGTELGKLLSETFNWPSGSKCHKFEGRLRGSLFKGTSRISKHPIFLGDDEMLVSGKGSSIDQSWDIKDVHSDRLWFWGCI